MAPYGSTIRIALIGWRNRTYRSVATQSMGHQQLVLKHPGDARQAVICAEMAMLQLASEFDVGPVEGRSSVVLHDRLLEAAMLVHSVGTLRARRGRVPGGSAALETHLSDPSLEWSDAPTLSFTISVVIPTKNEARNIGWVLERIGPLVDEIVIVDGLSDDGTVEAAIAARPDCVVVQHRVAGKGEAIRAGFAAATGDLIVILDADGSMDPGEIPIFVEELAHGSDFVKGSRFMQGGGTSDMTRVRSFGNAMLVRLANLLLRTSYTELCYGYMAFRRSRLEELDLRASGFEIETELVVKACRAGLAVMEIPSFESSRRYGTSNLNTFRDGWRVLRTLVRQRYAASSEVPRRPRLFAEAPGRQRRP